MAVVGVLAVQGAFAVHEAALRALGHRAVRVRAAAELEGLEGMVLPGGESTVQLELVRRLGLEAPLARLLASGAPVLATCAGLVLLARRVKRTPDDGDAQRSFGLVDVEIVRNAWGRQIHSFEATSDRGRALVFIRAPRIMGVGPAVEVLDTFAGEPVLVREGAATCATFHPELTPDRGLHAAVFGQARPTRARHDGLRVLSREETRVL